MEQTIEIYHDGDLIKKVTLKQYESFRDITFAFVVPGTQQDTKVVTRQIPVRKAKEVKRKSFHFRPEPAYIPDPPRAKTQRPPSVYSNARPYDQV